MCEDTRKITAVLDATVRFELQPGMHVSYGWIHVKLSAINHA